MATLGRMVLDLLLGGVDFPEFGAPKVFLGHPGIHFEDPKGILEDFL